MKNLFNNKYKDDILGMNSTYDRVIIRGSLIPIAYAAGLEIFLSANNILLKNFKAYGKLLAETLKEHAKSIATEEKVPYIYLDNSHTRKDTLIKSIIGERGEHPGLVAVLSASEVDYSFDIRKNRETKKLELVPRERRCLHIYYYFIDTQLGLCFFRVQTYFPFKVQIYLNGREELARKLDKANIKYQKDDNCFIWIEDFSKAQELADDLDIPKLHSIFDRFAEKYVPILKDLRKKWELSYHWSIRQIEYARDIIFKSQERLDSIYKQLLQYLVISTMPEDVMSFPGKKLRGRQGGRIETDSKKTYLGYRIKHRNGAISIKAYNKSGNVLRIEVTMNNISEIKVTREVEQKDGQVVKKLARLKRSIYSLVHLIRIGKASTNRYLDFLSKMEDNSNGVKGLHHLTEKKIEDNKNYRGFNPLNREDNVIFQSLTKASYVTNGFTNRDLRISLTERLKEQNWNTSKISRLIKRLKVFGLIKRVYKRYRYHLTKKGRLLITLAVKLRNLVVIPTVDSLLKNINASLA